MRWRMVGAVLVGSVVVAAACSATNGGTSPQAGSDGGAVDAVLDSITDALGLDHVVADAHASEKPTVKQIDCASDGKGNWLAVLDLAGRDRDDIGRSSALGCTDGKDYPCTQMLLQVRDGSLRAYCGSDALHSGYVRFSVPPTP